MQLIGQAHTRVHELGVGRVQTDIRVGTRWVSSSHPLLYCGTADGYWGGVIRVGVEWRADCGGGG